MAANGGDPIGLANPMGRFVEVYKGWLDFVKYTSFVVGDGSRIKFWHDSWCGDHPLGSFPGFIPFGACP
jgi:hypothetical protein